MPTFNEENASFDTLRSLFDTAAIECEMDGDGDLYVHDGIDFPFWIRIDADQKMLVFITYLTPKPGQSFAEVAAWANRANANVVLAQFYASEAEDGGGRLSGTYFLPYAYGIDGRLIVRMARRFAKAFVAGSRYDEDRVTN